MSSPPVDRREILALAVPAFLALVAEPLYLLADSAIVGHLGTVPLAGLGVAGSVLLSATGLFIFLAYATTSAVARRLGAGSPAEAVARGLDGLWLSAGLGLAVAVLLNRYAAPLAAAFGPTEPAHAQAVTYLQVAAFGLPAMLAVLAATGTLRGLLDTRTPLLAAVSGFTGNIGLNLLFVHGLHWGIAGSAWGTVLAQNAMGAGLVAVVVRRAHRLGVAVRPRPAAVLGAARGGLPLLVRTVALRTVLLVAVWAAAQLGDVPLAAHQIVATVWSVLAFTVDALAIAAQAIVGRELGAGRVAAARAATATMLRWGVGSGVLLGVLVVVIRGPLTALFTPDPAVQRYAAAALVVVGAGQLVSGYVFVADGVLMGAGDFGYLAWAMLGVLAAYLPAVVVARALLGPPDPTAGAALPGTALPVQRPGDLVVLWIAFLVMMLARAITLGVRLRSGRWAVTGATR